MEKNDIDKIETLVGYLKYFYENCTPDSYVDELSDVIKEANEWVNDLKNTACDHVFDVFDNGFSKCIYCGISDPNEK